MTLYPKPEIRVVRKLVSGAVTTEKTMLHHDGLGAVRAVTSAAGLRAETSSYRPFGEQSQAAHALNTPEAKGFPPILIPHINDALVCGWMQRAGTTANSKLNKTII